MQITIYSTSICSACHALTGWLDKQGISYDKIITDEDPAGMAAFMAVNDGMLAVPFTVIDDGSGTPVKLSGFDPAEFRDALKL